MKLRLINLPSASSPIKRSSATTTSSGPAFSPHSSLTQVWTSLIRNSARGDHFNSAHCVEDLFRVDSLPPNPAADGCLSTRFRARSSYVQLSPQLPLKADICAPTAITVMEIESSCLRLSIGRPSLWFQVRDPGSSPDFIGSHSVCTSGLRCVPGRPGWF